MNAISHAYAVYTGVGKENMVANNIKKAARRCKDILSASFLFPGYVRVEVVAGDNAKIKNAKFDIPKNTKMVIELVPGVINICGSGKEIIPL